MHFWNIGVEVRIVKKSHELVGPWIIPAALQLCTVRLSLVKLAKSSVFSRINDQVAKARSFIYGPIRISPLPYLTTSFRWFLKQVPVVR
jgi:hypothetical protein